MEIETELHKLPHPCDNALVCMTSLVLDSLAKKKRMRSFSSFGKALNQSSSVSSSLNSGISSKYLEVCVESLGAVIESSFYVTEKAWQCQRKLVSVSSSSARESLAMSIRVLRIVATGMLLFAVVTLLLVVGGLTTFLSEECSIFSVKACQPLLLGPGLLIEPFSSLTLDEDIAFASLQAHLFS
ncbi:hypothetical protein SO802_007795 [Lithocarpus litseifolius]|uniref:Uncharacterized protein n=1 Tax=Lithocarpus litseifolius TaxID=425828 RepID=A0AAW2DQ14_9ROSI